MTINSTDIINHTREVAQICNLDVKNLKQHEFPTYIKKIGILASHPSCEENGWEVLNLLYMYTMLIIGDTRKLVPADKKYAMEALAIIQRYVINRKFRIKKNSYADKALWLAAKWGYYEPEFLREAIALKTHSLEFYPGGVDDKDLTRFIWSYASVLPNPEQRDERIISAWNRSFRKVYEEIHPHSHLWGNLIPAMEYLKISLLSEELKNRLAKNFQILNPFVTSDFEKDVAYMLGIMKVAFKQDATISVYRPDFIITRGTKKLILECDGDRYHPFPKTLRKKILLQRGYYYVKINGSEYEPMDFSHKLDFLWKIIHELDSY